MGIPITSKKFFQHDYDKYSERLYQSLLLLKEVMRSESFDQGQKKIGAELETYIVDESGNVKLLNEEIINTCQNKLYTQELNKFNLEINCEPLDFQINAFSKLEEQINSHLTAVNEVARRYGAYIVPTGILPTLRPENLCRANITESLRYQALSETLYQMRGRDFEVHIKGQDELKLSCDHVAIEGANTSFQFHLMVDPGRFADVFNAVQLTTALVIAVSANSPQFLGKSLWDETRIALFKQSIDSRLKEDYEWRQPSRVSFGHGWVRENAWELFAEAVALYPPLFPEVGPWVEEQDQSQNQLPKFDELCLHMGTIWPWNRPVYSHHDSGHIRVEMRSLPAGPSVKDMCANAAFASGLAYGLMDGIQDYLSVMPFRFAEYNFYRAAQSGLDASIVWTDLTKHQATERPIAEVILSLLPVAEKGLAKMGITSEEGQHYLEIIRQRVEKKTTGARWQRQAFEHFSRHENNEMACQNLFMAYHNQQSTQRPVSEWPTIG